MSMTATMPGLSAGAQFRLGQWGAGGNGAAGFGQGVGAPATPNFVASGSPTPPRWSPQHPGWWPAMFAAVGLAAFGYATERRFGVKVEGRAGPAEAEAGASV